MRNIYQKLASVTALSLVLGACASSPVPFVGKFEPSTQKKLASSHHWDVVASDVANQMAQTLSKNDSLKGRPVYFSPPSESSVFSKAFQSLLITRMIDTGLSVSTKKEGAAETRIETQVVRHSSDRKPGYAPGTLTALVAGVMVARNVALHMSGDAQAIATLGLVGAADASTALAPEVPPQTEIIVTTSITAGDKYIARKSDVYYLADVDIDLFLERHKKITPTKTFTVVDK